MVVFNSVVLASIQAVLLFFNIKTLTSIKYGFRDYIAMICIIIPSTVLYYFFNEKATIFLLVLSLYLCIKGNKPLVSWQH